jgi:hypothetical protein
MLRVLKAVVVLIAVLFVVNGMSWLVDPAASAARLGMVLQEGVGLSSQIGDLAAFFIVLGSSTLVAVITLNRTWFYPPIVLLGCAAAGRVIAWLVHDAALALDMILVEMLVACLLFLASRKLVDKA